ncbi:TPA: serine--tRNA ligase [Candidatus Dependentiae bacterium]|nr:MAG: serine--tRNA ligase [Clostridiales bacterium GWF2_38_85]HBL98942.1 serine--tRNA ligase [Candidatus Dependentiae bacterium]
MIDLALLRDDPEGIKALIQKKDPSFDVVRLAELDKHVRSLRHVIEDLRSEKNTLAKQGQQGVSSEIREKSNKLGDRIKEHEEMLEQSERLFKDLYLRCPNLLADDVQSGGKESNLVVRQIGVQPTFDFPVKTHVELTKALGWVDFEAATAMTASNFALYRNEAVRLHYALCMFMLNTAQSFGFAPVLPPFLINERALEGASNFPRFKEEVYAVEKDGLYLTPTAEVNLANLYRDTILSEQELPIRLTALTSCFRREAGGYGAAERGLIRIHQFDKVELFTLTKPEESPQEQERMLACAESILQKLGLHYRVTLLAAQDCSFASSKTYDIEVWMPGQKEYKEVSSISNCTDFQARRCAIRCRAAAGEKTRLIHTLNGSSLALPRLVVALLETGQRADGSIVFPEILKSVSVGVS